MLQRQLSRLNFNIVQKCDPPDHINKDNNKIYFADKHRSSDGPKSDMIREDITSEPFNDDDMNYRDSDDSYRTKRSIETQNFLFHIKNPKIKNILTSRLETLLEALDAEELPQNTKTEQTREKDEIQEVPPDHVAVAEESKVQDDIIKKRKEENMLHLTMHNVLLQGIIGHMNLNEVYKRVNTLMKTMDEEQKEQTVNERSEEKSIKTQPSDVKSLSKSSLDDRLVAELIKCNDLQEQILSSAVKQVAKQESLKSQRAKFIEGPEPSTKEPEEESEVKEEESVSVKANTEDTTQRNSDVAVKTKLGPNLLIKTTVDIRSIENERNDTISKENVHGIVEVIYNGKSMKFTKPDKEEPIVEKETNNIVNEKFTNTRVDTVSAESTSASNPSDDVQTLKKKPKIYLNKVIAEYLKQFSSDNKDLSEEIKEHIETKRLKRHVKIKFNNEKSGTQASNMEITPTKKDTEDDELYVEIETHFDSKGMKGERKKKLIRSLIDKIQKAIHSEDNKKVGPETTNKMLKDKPLHVKKRMQNPLEHKNQGSSNKYNNLVPVSKIVHRQLNPIIVTQTFPGESTNNGPNMRDRSGEAWKKEIVGPAFLTATKSINSAEMSEVEVDYNRVLDVNGIPQRLQKPLNTDMSDDIEKQNSYFDLGNMKFFIKDIDGSGFSIGFNQYVDEAPDPETIKLFTGLENVINTYHQDVDQVQEGQGESLDPHDDQTTNGAKNNHIIVRRSVNHQHDYHSNEYKIIYDGNFLPFNDYKDIYERESSKPNMEYKENQYRDSPLIVDEHIFDKNLKPAEIFGLANLFRKKRALKVKKISNLKSKIKLNRYLNTKAMSTKRIFLKKKRHKRQISKIRIIASDMPYKRSSDGNIFLVSGENVFADRAIVKDVEAAEADSEKNEDSDYTLYQPEDVGESLYKEFEKKSRKNNLMSKYPHVFMEEISKSKEDFSPAHSLLFHKLPDYKRSPTYNIDSENADDNFMTDTSSTIQPESEVTMAPFDKIEGVHDILAALQAPKTNYKVTVKVIPKNQTNNMHPGFKEIHTSINKIYNKNGLTYSSLVNVSEISNITHVHVNKTEHKAPDYTKAADEYLAKQFKTQHEKMQTLLKQHQKLINEQLSKLNKEKSNLESILIDENNTVVPHFDYFDLMTPSKSHKLLHMSRDEVKKMADEILKNKRKDIFNTETTTVKTTPITTSTTTILNTPSTTTEHPEPITIKTTMSTHPSIFTEKLKNNILHTIERNEKLTDQILRKVDKNTEILQSFLTKLTNTIDNQKTDLRAPTTTKEGVTELYIPKFEHMQPFSIDWRQHGAIPYNPSLIKKNSSHISIPFLYAYQHPLMPLKGNSPVASVVYHGTIHTNSLHLKDVAVEKEKIQPTHKIPTSKNQTRFFLDDVESDYKLQHPTRLVYKSNDGSTLSVSDSYVEKPTLKEIIYYHLIEKPYPEEQEQGKTKAETPEDTIDLVEDVEIDPRKDEPAKNSYFTENWVPFTSDLSRKHTQQLPEYVREIFTEQKPVVKSHNPKYAYVVGHISSILAEKENEVIGDNELDSESSSDESDIVDDTPSYTEEPNVVEYLEYDELDENNSSEDDADVSIEKEKDFNKGNKPEASGIFLESTTIRYNKDSGENSKVSDNSEDDWTDNTALDDDSDSNEDSGSLEDEEIECEDGKVCDESGEGTNTNFDDILNEIHQIFIKENSTIELSPATIDNQQNFNVLSLLQNVLKEHSKSTNQSIVIQTNQNQPSFLDALRGLFTNIVKNNVVINNHVPVMPVHIAAEKDRLNDREKPNENTKKPISEQNFKEHGTTTESPKETNLSNYIDQSKDKDFTAPPLESTTATAIVINATEIDKNKSNDTDKLINSTSTQVSSTTLAMETESSSIRTEKPTTPGEQEPTTSNPNKIENNATNEKEDGADVNKKIDFMLDLVNNKNFWEFMGDLGGKYLESLMAHTQSVIKEQITTQVKEHFDALNKYDEKLLEKKDEVKENKPVKEPKENAGGKNREAKNINETVSIKAHNLFGNTVGNDKVTNVYVFYANEHIDEIIKNIHEIANKTKPVNSTNIFTFISNQFEVNNGTSKPTTPIVSEVTTELPKKTVNHVGDKTNNEQNPTNEQNETTANISDIKNPNIVGNQSETDSNCHHDKSRCDKIENSTNPTVNTDQDYNITVHPTQNSVASTTVSKEQTPEVETTPVVDLKPDKVPVTETTDTLMPNTDKISSTEPITAKIDITTESIAAAHTTVTQVTSIEVQTEISQHTTHFEATTNADLTTESVISKGTTIADVTIESSTERNDDINHKNNETSLNINTIDDYKDKITTENVKPVTDNISSSTESTSTIQLTTLVITTLSTTEKIEGVNNLSNEIPQNTSSREDDKDKVTTESMKPVTSYISSTTEVISTVSGVTIDSTSEKHDVTSDDNKVTTESSNSVTSDITSTAKVTSKASDTIIESITEKHDVTINDDKAEVTTESMKPVATEISSTTEVISTVSGVTINSTSEKHDITSDDDKAKVTTESMKPVTSDITSTAAVTSTVSETTIESTTEKHDVTSDDDKAKVTTESMKPVTSEISSTTEVISKVSGVTINSTSEKHDVTSDDNKAKATTESTKPVTSDISSTTAVTSRVSDTTIVSSTEKHDVTDSLTNNIKLTTEAVNTETVDISVDQADKNHTILNIENSNSTANHSEILSTTESPEHKTDSISITTETVTEKTADNTKSTKDESHITTEKFESTRADTEVKEATESTTEKHEEDKS
ncbi:unnamed protein product [Arctia plantaginis]|uniref:Uncharacterized protein n=1 Tax=Arctia plantaginis TaxID=874455 RepID=A0A8S0ZLG2_ARCPL|nr:unnamed protein product [Arctia plantaginis]